MEQSPPPFAAAYRVGEVVPVGDDMGSLVGLWRRPLCVGQPLPVLPCTDRFAIPRFFAPGLAADEFRAWLLGHLG